MPSYFDLLAPELIQIIFIFCIEKRNGYFIEYNVNAPPLVFLRVCKRWHFIAFQTPGIFDSISFRQRVRKPLGFDFTRDSYILYDFIHFPRSGCRTPAKPRPLSMQLCYGDIKHFGDNLMWSDLLRMVRAIVDATENLERLYLRFPDDCMEKLLMKICSESENGMKHSNLRSLTLHSTREILLTQRYITWWYDAEGIYMPAYYHKLDTTQLPALEELGLHYPGPLTIEPVCQTVRKLHVSIFKWEQLEEYLTGCPNVENLTVELREALLDQDWDVAGVDPTVTFPRVHTLEIRSAIVGWACANKLFKLFLGLRVPHLKVLRLRRLPQADKAAPPHFCYGSLIMGILNKLEELEFIDFAPEPHSNWDIGTMFTAAPNLRRLVYRESEMVSSPEYFARLISELTFFGNILRAPRLETLELDSVHLRAGENTIIQGLLQLIASRRTPAFFVNTGGIKRGKAPALPSLLRKVRLPLGCSDIVRRMDMFGMCRGVEFDCVLTLDELELEDDLDEEGPPRKEPYGWNSLRWPAVEEPEIPKERHDPEFFEPEMQGAAESSTPLPSESIMEVEQMLSQDDEEGNGTLRVSSQGSFGLTRYDSLAEVELLL